jgi:hypothetical protein
LEDDSVTFNKCERFLLVHNAPSATSSVDCLSSIAQT